MFDLGPITAINGVALDLSTTPEVTGKRTSSAKLVSYEPGTEQHFRPAISPRADLPAVTTFGEGTACGQIGHLARSARRAENCRRASANHN
jgi:hypothetical protein